jgi:thiol:disulfide interchange protein DsbD
MKAIGFFLPCLLLSQMTLAQSSNQVKWAYKAKKIGDKKYAVYMTATINKGYHLYAQDAGGDGPTPTRFTFVKSPLLTMDGNVKEEGKLVRKYETVWSHDVKYYEKTVDFVQLVKLLGGAKTNFAGKVEFMVCNDRLCERPSEVEIKVNIGG